MSSTDCAWPCAVSTTRKSTPASMSAWARRLASSPTPTAAPTTRRPPSSLVACGNFSLLVKSLTVMSPRSRPPASISGSFSILCSLSSASAWSGLDPHRGGDQRHLGHDVFDLPGQVVLEPDVAVGDDAEQDAVVAGDRHAGDPVMRAEPLHVRERRVRAAGDRVGDHPGLRPLDQVDLLRLLLDGQVPVQHPDPAVAGHRDRHPRLGHGVHRARDKRDAQPVLAGDPGAGVRLARHQLRVGRQEQHVIEGQAYRGKLLGHDVLPSRLVAAPRPHRARYSSR